jgi:hypothetical protein
MATTSTRKGQIIDHVSIFSSQLPRWTGHVKRGLTVSMDDSVSEDDSSDSSYRSIRAARERMGRWGKDGDARKKERALWRSARSFFGTTISTQKE